MKVYRLSSCAIVLVHSPKIAQGRRDELIEAASLNESVHCTERSFACPDYR